MPHVSHHLRVIVEHKLFARPFEAARSGQDDLLIGLNLPTKHPAAVLTRRQPQRARKSKAVCQGARQKDTVLGELSWNPSFVATRKNRKQTGSC